jgi:hypothetical protein
MPSREDLCIGGYFDLDQGGPPFVVRIAARLTEAHQFDADPRARSNSGSDGIFSRDKGLLVPQSPTGSRRGEELRRVRLARRLSRT